MTQHHATTEAELAALLDPGAAPEAPAAFRLTVIERAFASGQARAARARASRLAAMGAGVGLLAPVIGALGLPLEAMQPAALASIAALGALLLAAIVIQGPARTFARAPRWLRI